MLKRFWGEFDHLRLFKSPKVLRPHTYEAVSYRVTERVLREDKSHRIGLTMSDLQNRVP